MELDLTQQEPLFACPDCGGTILAKYDDVEEDGRLERQIVWECPDCHYVDAEAYIPIMPLDEEE